MNSIEYVKLAADAGDYVAPKYAIIESTIGSTAATSFVWLKSVSYGFVNESDYDTYIANIDTAGPDKSLLKGSIGVYTVASIDSVVSYSRPRKIKDIGYYPYG